MIERINLSEQEERYLKKKGDVLNKEEDTIFKEALQKNISKREELEYLQKELREKLNEKVVIEDAFQSLTGTRNVRTKDTFDFIDKSLGEEFERLKADYEECNFQIIELNEKLKKLGKK